MNKSIWILIWFEFYKSFQALLLYSIQADEMRDIVEMSTRMEERYSHLFDSVIINDDLETASEQLLRLAASLEKDPQWVPIGWSYN